MTKQTIKAQADGRNGQIDFEIDLENNKISDVKVTKNSETPAIFNQAFGKLKKNIIDNQSFDVDAVSGASLMTQAMLDSGKKALAENNIALDGSTTTRVRPRAFVKYPGTTDAFKTGKSN